MPDCIKKWMITMVSIVIVLSAKAQLLNAKDSLALKIPVKETYSTAGISTYVKSNFAGDSARLRAIFVWLANNISYDVELLKRMSPSMAKITTEDVLKSRKAVCQGYAELMVELLRQCNIPAMLIPGYGKLPNGTVTPLSHAWVAAEVNKTWRLYDPTWAAGTVYNDQFKRTFSNTYYNLSPEEMIKDHMPFDPLHQFLNYPITANEFYEGKKENGTPVKYFNYADSIRLHQSLSLIEQSRNAIRRIQANGIRTDLIRLEVDRLNRNLSSYDGWTGYQSAAGEYKAGIDLFNKYIKNKNERFAAVKPTEIQQLLEGSWQHVLAARSLIEGITPKDDQLRKALYEIKNELYQFSLRVEQEQGFVKKYLGKG